MKYFNLLILSSITFLLVSCKGGSPSPSPNYKTYVLGVLGNDLMCWENGVAVRMGTAIDLTVGNNVKVYNGDVYAAGQMYTDTDLYPHAVYFKNGVITNLGHGAATDVAVNGSDVYVVGETFIKDTLYAASWKNGVVTTYAKGEIACIKIENGIIYMGGVTYPPASAAVATLWKNDVANELGVGDISSIAISGNDFYAVGDGYTQNSPAAVYWKNGMLFTIGGIGTHLSSITVSGNDVYVAGDAVDNTVHGGAYWKNGTRNFVSGVGYISGISVVGNDVFLSANQSYAPAYAGVQNIPTASFLVENGKMTTLATVDPPYGNTYTVAIAVVKQ